MSRMHAVYRERPHRRREELHQVQPRRHHHPHVRQRDRHGRDVHGSVLRRVEGRLVVVCAQRARKKYAMCRRARLRLVVKQRFLEFWQRIALLPVVATVCARAPVPAAHRPRHIVELQNEFSSKMDRRVTATMSCSRAERGARRRGKENYKRRRASCASIDLDP